MAPDESNGDLAAIALDPGDAFDAISNHRRRHTILSLERSSEPIPAGDLAVELAAIEHGITPSAVTGDQRTTVYISLIQNHLPRLDDLGIIDFDDRSKIASGTGKVPPLAEYIRRVEAACYHPQEETDADAE